MKSALPPLKRFGQNFLIDKNIVRKIIASVSITKDDRVLEIGPGRGILTHELAESARSVAAIEIDRGLCLELEARNNFPNLDILCKDILKFNIARFAKKNKIKSFKVVANLPYYITTPIIEYLFINRRYIKDIFIMVQREVAERMISCPKRKTYSAFSCFINYFSTPDALFNIKGSSFFPKPKVDSSFVRLSLFSDPVKYHGVRSEKLLFEIMRAAFGQRRKQIGGVLARKLGRQAMSKLGCNAFLRCRAQDLSLKDFISLSNLLAG